MTDKYRLWRPKESFLPEDFALLREGQDQPDHLVQPKKRKIQTHSARTGPRKLSFTPNFVSNANGSCYLEQGQTKVLITVHGPQACGSKREREQNSDGINSCQIKTFYKNTPFASQRRQDTGPETADEKLKARLLSQAITPLIQLHEYPKMIITVSCLVLQDEGCALPAAITGCSLALATAGLKMYDFAVGLGFSLDQNQKLIVDPETPTPDITVSYLPSVGQFSLFEVNECVDDELVNQILEESQKAGNEIYVQQNAAV